MSEAPPPYPDEDLLPEAVYEPGPAAPEALVTPEAPVAPEAPPVLDPDNWLRMKQTDLPTINAQIAAGLERLDNLGEFRINFLNNLPGMLPGGWRTVGGYRKALESDHETLGHAAKRRGNPDEWTEDEKKLRSDHIKNMTNGKFFEELAEAVKRVGGEMVEKDPTNGLSAEGFEFLNGLRTLGKLEGKDLGRHEEFLFAVYRKLRQPPFGFSHDDLSQ